jgi:MtN3 and saliva related transmembrane protein
MNTEQLTDAIGWTSAAVLAWTISRQVYKQWRSKSTAGVSKWLFIGQLTASLGFSVYSVLVKNWVFVFTNFYMFLAAIVGQCIYLRNKRGAAGPAQQHDAHAAETMK